MATQVNGSASVPFSGFQFEVYSRPNDGYNPLPEGQIGFTEVQGLSDETESVTYKEGNDLYPDMLPGQTTPQEITLSRGVDKSGFLLAWRNKVREATYVGQQKFRADVFIVQYDRSGTDHSNPNRADIVQGWLLEDAWPKSYAQDDLNSTNSEISMERVVLCYRGAIRVVIANVPSPGVPNA